MDAGGAPGRYLGQCTEYCGYQHAHMQFEVVAESAADFQQWVRSQLRRPRRLRRRAVRGLAIVEYRCGLCHQVRGTAAGAVSAPDLTHLMSRRTLAAGTLLNNPGNLAGWIEDPQAEAREPDAESIAVGATTVRHARLPGDTAMRLPDYRTPAIGTDSVEHEARLLGSGRPPRASRAFSPRSITKRSASATSSPRSFFLVSAASRRW